MCEEVIKGVRMKKNIRVYFNIKSYLEKQPNTMIWITQESTPEDYIYDLRNKYKEFMKSDDKLFIIYTKSDFIIRELSSMIMAHKILKFKGNVKELEDCYKFKLEEYAINPKIIKVYNADFKEYKISPMQGIFCTDLDFGIDMQNEMQGELHNKVFDLSEEEKKGNKKRSKNET